MSDRKKTIETLLSMAEDASNFVDENEGRIKDLLGNNNTVSLKEESPMKEAHKYEDKVVFVAETSGDGISDLKLRHFADQDKLEVDLGDDSVTLLIPDNCKPQEAEYSVSNGVLQLDIPRDVPEEIELDEASKGQKNIEEYKDGDSPEEEEGEEEQDDKEETDNGGGS